MKNLDFQLLKDLFCVFSPSMREKKMRRFIKRHIALNVPDANVQQDDHGNLLITKGIADTYPCLCAHMDQVQDLHPKDFVCVDDNGVIFGYSPKMHKQCGLGADDKNGLFIALTCLKEYDVLKCAFFVGEEIGCVGSSRVDTHFFDDCRFCVQIDRRGNSDMVTEISCSPLCSGDFIEDTHCEQFGYAVSSGLMTDVEALRGNGVPCSCINLSCGYYEPHTDREFVVKADVQKCYNFVCGIIENCTRDYACLPVSSYGGGWSHGPINWDYDDCMDYCADLFCSYPEMTCEEFVTGCSGQFETLKIADLKEIYDITKSYLS